MGYALQVSAADSAASPRRRPKGDKRERTRARLIEAAGAVIREKGFEHTTLAEVADRAGVTTGAIYGNFRNRDDLFMAVAEVRGAPIMPRMWPGMSFAELMRSYAEAVIAAAPQRKAAFSGTQAFHAYSLAHEEIRARVLQAKEEIYRQGAAFFLRFAPAEALPMPPEVLMPVLHGLTDGLLLHRIVTPELIPDEVIYEAFEAFARLPAKSGA